MLKNLLMVMLLSTPVFLTGCEQPQGNNPYAISVGVPSQEELNTGRKVLVFTKDDCRRCVTDRPLLNRLRRSELDGEVIVINADEHQELAEKYGVTSYPTYITVEDGFEIARFENLVKLLKFLKFVVWLIALAA